MCRIHQTYHSFQTISLHQRLSTIVCDSFMICCSIRSPGIEWNVSFHDVQPSRYKAKDSLQKSCLPHENQLRPQHCYFLSMAAHSVSLGPPLRLSTTNNSGWSFISNSDTSPLECGSATDPDGTQTCYSTHCQVLFSDLF